MDAATLRRLAVVQKSPIQQKLDTRPRCEECGLVISDHDIHGYWVEAGTCETLPRTCEDCAEQMECKSA